MIKPLATAVNGFSEDCEEAGAWDGESEQAGAPHSIRLKAKRGLRQRVLSFSY